MVEVQQWVNLHKKVSQVCICLVALCGLALNGHEIKKNQLYFALISFEAFSNKNEGS